MTAPVALLAALLILTVVGAVCIAALTGAWIAHAARQGKSPIPPVFNRPKAEPKPAEEPNVPRRIKL